MNQTIRLNAMYSAGREAALSLQSTAASMTGTEIIDQEYNAPAFNPEKDYTSWPRMSPVTDEGQVWLLLQPHNASHYPGIRPSTNRACWGLAHTTDPAKAKPWVNPFGTSGMYMKGECYRTEDGVIYRCKVDNTVHDAAALPGNWEEILL